MKNLLLRLVIALAMAVGIAQATPLFKVGTDESLPPYSFVRGGKAVGIDVDMLHAAAKRLDLKIEVVPLPWKRVLVLLQSGELPLAMPLFRTPERESFARFTGPVHVSQNGLFVRKGEEFPFTSIDDLTGKRIGLNRGFVLADDFDRAIRQGKVMTEEVGTIDQNVKKLGARRIDAFAGNVVSTRYVLRGTSAETKTAVLPRLLSENRPAYLVVSRTAKIPDQERLVETLRRTLEDLHRDGTYAKIVESYLKP